MGRRPGLVERLLPASGPDCDTSVWPKACDHRSLGQRWKHLPMEVPYNRIRQWQSFLKNLEPFFQPCEQLIQISSRFCRWLLFPVANFKANVKPERNFGFRPKIQ